MARGIVKWYDKKKGYGFIQSEEGADVFIHYSDITAHSEHLQSGQKVEYQVAQGKKGPVAVNVTSFEFKAMAGELKEVRDGGEEAKRIRGCAKDRTYKRIIQDKLVVGDSQDVPDQKRVTKSRAIRDVASLDELGLSKRAMKALRKLGDIESIPVASSRLRVRDDRLQVEIHIPDAVPECETMKLEAIQNAIGEFLRNFGFEPDPATNEVVHASWHWTEWFRRNQPALEKEGKEVYDEVKEALRRAKIDEPGANAFEKRAGAAAQLLASLDSYDEVSVRLGDVLLVKVKQGDKAYLFVETISPNMARELEKQPSILMSPQATLEFLRKRVACEEVGAAEEENKLSGKAAKQAARLPGDTAGLFDDPLEDAV